jgi:hypothetical protein
MRKFADTLADFRKWRAAKRVQFNASFASLLLQNEINLVNMSTERISYNAGNNNIKEFPNSGRMKRGDQQVAGGRRSSCCRSKLKLLLVLAGKCEYLEKTKVNFSPPHLLGSMYISI